MRVRFRFSPKHGPVYSRGIGPAIPRHCAFPLAQFPRIPFPRFTHQSCKQLILIRECFRSRAPTPCIILSYRTSKTRAAPSGARLWQRENGHKSSESSRRTPSTGGNRGINRPARPVPKAKPRCHATATRAAIGGCSVTPSKRSTKHCVGSAIHSAYDVADRGARIPCAINTNK